MLIDQAQKLRELAEKNKFDSNNRSYKGPRIITVTSGKGGVGKSNFVVNLALTLQKKGSKVMLFDADVGMGNDDILLGFITKYNVYDLIYKNKSIDEVIVKGPFGVSLLPGGTGLTNVEQLSEEERAVFLNKLSELKDIDFLIMDTGAGINKSVLGFIACCEELIILTTPEPTSLTDAYSLLKAVNHFKIKQNAKVVVNRALDEKEACITYDKFNNAVDKFLNMKLEYLGKVSEDRKVIQSVRKQEPFTIAYPNSEASRDIECIALKLLGENEKSSTIENMFRKIFNIFS